MAARVGNYYLFETLGEGAFGKVKLGVHESTGEQVAVKIMDKKYIRASEMAMNVRREIAIMKALKHRNIVEMKQVLSSATKLYIIMELVTGGELFTKILKEGKIEERLARKYFQQLVDGVDYCHRRGICHRDLKPENLLIDEATGDLKITDFGLSTIRGGVESAEELLHTQCGSPNYCAPEILSSAKAGYSGQRVDVWSCGIVLFAILAGYLPFYDEDTKNLYRMIREDDVRFPRKFPVGARDLVKQLLNKDPDRRMTLAECRKHPWFSVDYKCDETVAEKLTQITLEGNSKSSPRKVGDDDIISEGKRFSTEWGQDPTTKLNSQSIAVDAKVVSKMSPHSIQEIEPISLIRTEDEPHALKNAYEFGFGRLSSLESKEEKIEHLVISYRQLFHVHQSGSLMQSRSFKYSYQNYINDPFLCRARSITDAWYVTLHQLVSKYCGEDIDVSHDQLAAFEALLEFWKSRAGSRAGDPTEEWWRQVGSPTPLERGGLRKCMEILNPKPAEDQITEFVQEDTTLAKHDSHENETRTEQNPTRHSPGLSPKRSHGEQSIPPFSPISPWSRRGRDMERRSRDVTDAQTNRAGDSPPLKLADRRQRSTPLDSHDRTTSFRLREVEAQLKFSLAARAVSDVTGGPRRLSSREHASPDFPNVVDQSSGISSGTSLGLSSSLKENQARNKKHWSQSGKLNTNPITSVFGIIRREAPTFESPLPCDATMRELRDVLAMDGCRLVKLTNSKMRVEVTHAGRGQPFLVSVSVRPQGFNGKGCIVFLRRAKSDRSSVHQKAMTKFLESVQVRFLARVRNRL
uniref:non-specific serine/threonine protein kinase n=1 Tax=Compsopogon caeruleus TaxID=31354 RepID=A0A7S1TJ88_9RHOD|mmetsp:Transcript_9312/g.19017  ORF Transcript_9312/g.19017 Transcript_9312/m.19017 type:complete len:805 (+) Transcript_9312:280-2694(+)